MVRVQSKSVLLQSGNLIAPALKMPDSSVLLDQMLAMGPDIPAGRTEDIPVLNRSVSIAYRAFEIVAALIAIVLTIPVMAAIALRIKCGSPGPVLFRQTRHGLNGRPFTFIKFRTLYHDARERFPQLYAYEFSEEDIRTIQFKKSDDPRITPEGRWLRKSSLDELPNLFSILTGDLALVGPRPQIPEMLRYYRGFMLERYSVRPGLTDLAHVSGRSDLSFYETTAMDVAYVRHQSFALDMKIIWRTIVAVTKTDGAF